MEGEGDDLLLSLKSDPSAGNKVQIMAEVLRHRKEFEITPIERLRDQFEAESANQVERDVKVSNADRSRVAKTVSYMDMETALEGALKGHIRRYACTFEEKDQSGTVSFEISREDLRPGRIAFEWVKLLQEKESLDSDYILKQIHKRTFIFEICLVKVILQF